MTRIIAVILLFTGLFELLLTLALIICGIFIGNYVQENKDSVKEKLKSFIDKF